jgi:5-methyltetrahydrofolate--homocysteine methyltransferase
MGTELDKRGVMSRGRNNLDAPETVLEIHQEYARCGCHALTTNTLTMNRIFIETHNVGVSVRDVNRAGAELAREAARDGQYVLGDISSTGQLLEPYGTYKESQFYDAFKEQAEILAEAGADAFIVETVFDLREALCALRACKDNFSIPAIVSIAFSTDADGGRTIMGPVLAQPNAGRPKLVEERTVFDMDPTTFAAGIAECLRAGALIVGGCCGTSPDHILAVASVLDDTSNP